MAKKLEKRQSRAVARAVDYKNVFGSGQGKRVLLDLMKEHSMLSPTIRVKIDPIELAFNEGARNVCLRILKLMKVDVAQLEKLMEDAENADETLY